MPLIIVLMEMFDSHQSIFFYRNQTDVKKYLRIPTENIVNAVRQMYAEEAPKGIHFYGNEGYMKPFIEEIEKYCDIKIEVN